MKNGSMEASEGQLMGYYHVEVGRLAKVDILSAVAEKSDRLEQRNGYLSHLDCG